MALGRGLSSLIPQNQPAKKPEAGFAPKDSKHKESVLSINISDIYPNPYQPRKHFKEDALKDLASSIKKHGILQPIVVCEVSKNGKKYQIIAGERRFRASKLAGLKQVPVIVRKGKDKKDHLELAILENIQREDLTPLEKAISYKQLQDEFGMTHAEIGEKLGKGRVSVSNTIRLLDLGDDIKKALEAGDISENHARAILSLPKGAMQSKLLGEIKTHKLSARNTEVTARAMMKKPAKSMLSQSPEIKESLSELENKLGTKVILKTKNHVSDGGEISISYFSNEDLKKILKKII